MKWIVYCLRPAFSGHRLQRPCSPGLAGWFVSSPTAPLPPGSVDRAPFSLAMWIGSSHGAGPWWRANGTRLPKWGLKCGHASLPVFSSNRIGGRLPGIGDLYFGQSNVPVTSGSPSALLPSHVQSHTVPSYAVIWPFSSAVCPGWPAGGTIILTQSLIATSGTGLDQSDLFAVRFHFLSYQSAVLPTNLSDVTGSFMRPLRSGSSCKGGMISVLTLG